MKCFAALCAAIAVLAVPASASASTGSITAIGPAGASQYTATFVSTSDQCGSQYYCGWYPYATKVGVGEVCDAYNTTGKLVYVGTLQDDKGIQGPATETFYALEGPPFKLCLSISYGSTFKAVVAEAIYNPGAPPASPGPAPTPAPTAAPVVDDDVTPYVAMTIEEGRGLAPDALKARYGSRFAKSTMTRACSRLSSRKIRCRVAWSKRPYKYSGTVTLWYGDDDAADDYSTYTYVVNVKRKRTSTPAKKRSSSAEPSAPAEPSCNPNYSGVCLQNGGDVNCGDISATDFRSVGSDPFRLDGDGDGIACES